MSDCRKCAKAETCAVDEDCGLYVEKQMTNADRIRAMTDEELAKWYFDEFFPSVSYCRPLGEECPDHKDCKICMLEWLKEEAQ